MPYKPEIIVENHCIYFLDFVHEYKWSVIFSGQKNENTLGPSNSTLYSCKMHVTM